MQRGLTHGAENGARSVLAGNVERIDGNAEKRQAKFAFRAFCKDVTAGRRRQEGGLVRETGALRLSAGGKGGTFRLQCASAAPVGRGGRRAAEFLPALRGRRTFEVAGGVSSACGMPPGARGERPGPARRIDAEDGCPAEGVRRFAQTAGGPCGARSSGPSATRMSLGKTTFRKGRACGLCFFIARDFARGKVCRAVMGKTQSKGARFGRRGLPARVANGKSVTALSAEVCPPQTAGQGTFRRRLGKMRQGRIAGASIYFFFFFCSRRHCQGGVGSLSCQRPRRSLRAMASSSFQVLQMSLVQK